MIKTVALCLIKVPLTVCVMWRVDIDHWGKFQGCTLLNKSTIRGKIRVARLDVYTGLCQTQSNYSITLHVEKLIYVNIYPPKCFYSVVPLKTCSSTQLKTIFLILSLYFKGVVGDLLLHDRKQLFKLHRRLNSNDFVPSYEVREKGCYLNVIF